jgi:hypothetical protein
MLGAVQAASSAIEMDPQNGYAFYLRGFTKYDLRDYEGSLQDLTTSLQLPSPCRSSALNCRGWVNRAMGINISSSHVFSYKFFSTSSIRRRTERFYKSLRMQFF